MPLFAGFSSSDLESVRGIRTIRVGTGTNDSAVFGKRDEFLLYSFAPFCRLQYRL